MADSTPPICSRMPSHVVDMLDADAQQQSLTRTEVINAIVENYYFGGSTLQGADEGYKAARRLAPMIAARALAKAVKEMPETLEEAQALFGR
jgi:hypothetical protein